MEWKNTGLYFILKLLYDKDIKYIYINLELSGMSE